MKCLNIQKLNIRTAVLACSLLLVSCMAKVENEDVIESVSITSHEIERDGVNAKIILHGVCPMATSALKINTESGGWDVLPSSMTSPSAWVDASGVPIGHCNNGVLRIEYPVPNPATSRMITFKVKSKMPDGKISLYAAIRDVDYSMPGESLPGYAVTSGGAFETTGAVRIHASAGIVYSSTAAIIVPGADASLRAGLHGILYDDSI